jgi:hypothetical protein
MCTEAESIFRIAKFNSYRDLEKYVNKPQESEVELISELPSIKITMKDYMVVKC